MADWIPPTPEELAALAANAHRSADAVAVAALAAGILGFDEADELTAALHGLVDAGDWRRVAALNR